MVLIGKGALGVGSLPGIWAGSTREGGSGRWPLERVTSRVMCLRRMAKSG